MKYIILFVIIVVIILLLINIKPLKPFNNNIFIINLVLYSDNNEYNEMYKLTRTFYKKFNNVKTIYYKFNENIINDYELVDDILNIKGTETYVPGILDKTIKAFEYVYNNYNFEYVVRSNISTIINFDLFINYLINNPIEYGGGGRYVLQGIDIPAGITDTTYFGTEYASGTSIVISKKILNDFIINKNKFNYDIVDDVAFGLIIDKHLKYINKKYFPSESFFYSPNENGDKLRLINLIKDKNYIFYRNRQIDRNMDVIQMKIIIYYINNN